MATPSEPFEIGLQALTVNEMARALRPGVRLVLLPEVLETVADNRRYLEHLLDQGDRAIYGVNTGFGSLCDIAISRAELRELQENLVRSHAAGMGQPTPRSVARLMLLLKIHALAQGFSGVRVQTLQRLVDHFNYDLVPVIPRQGSLGASGDLAPLAHLALPLLGEGEVEYQGRVRPTSQVYGELVWEPLTLGAKEGLALLNGTQFMLAYGIVVADQYRRLMKVAESISALAFDAFDCKLEPLSVLLHHVRPHPGQVETAANLLALLQESPLATAPKKQVQDPYSFRCLPQVHGASLDALNHVYDVLYREVHSVTDNPIVFHKDDQILSGGNFHGQPLALALDYLKLAMAETANISERRVFQLLAGKRGLPEFLIGQVGLNSGLMIAQYTAASLVSQNKQLCSPASVDSIPSCNNQEDHVSMGANAALQAWEVLANTRRVFAIELLTASQALHFRSPQRTALRLEAFLEAFRAQVPIVQEDRYLAETLQQAEAFVQNQAWRLPLV